MVLRVQESGQPMVFDGQNARPAPSKDSVRQVMLGWPTRTGARWVVQSLPHADQDGWITIFDGTHLYGFRPNDSRFVSGRIRIEDHCLRLEKNTSLNVAFVTRDVAIRARFKMVSAPATAPVMLGFANIPGHKFLSYFSGRRSYKRFSHGAGVYFFAIAWNDPNYKDIKGR